LMVAEKKSINVNVKQKLSNFLIQGECCFILPSGSKHEKIESTYGCKMY